MSTVIAIDPNVRISGNETYAGFEDLLDGSLGDLQTGEQVTVCEPEAGLIGDGSIRRIDHLRQLIYIAVDWKSLRVGASPALCGAGAIRLA